MANSVSSPTRQYVINYKDADTGESHQCQIYRLPETYVNNVNGASAFYRDTSSPAKWEIISCVPYEFHVERIREQEEASNHILVSPSRSYVLFTKDPVSDQEDIYLVTLPYQYDNNELEATRYLYKNRLPEPNIINCLTFEMYVKEEPGIRPLIGPTNKIVKVTMQSKKPGQDLLSNQKKVLEDLRASVAKLYDEVELHIENLKG